MPPPDRVCPRRRPRPQSAISPRRSGSARSAPGPGREAAIDRLYGVLLLAARGEVRRRSGQLRISGPEADDLAHQAEGDALMAIYEKLERFRGQSRFTTWAYKFVVLEVSSKVGRHFWRTADAAVAPEDWERLPDRIGIGPAEASEWRDLLKALRSAIENALTDHQRRVFVAVVLDEVPVDALAVRLGSTRNALYKTLFDARRNLRLQLERGGHLPPRTSDPT